jgi:hypothetical protein
MRYYICKIGVNSIIIITILCKRRPTKALKAGKTYKKASKSASIEVNSYPDLDLKELRRLVKIWRDNELNIKKDSSETAVLIQYASCVEEVNKHDRLKGLFFVKNIRYEEDMKGIKN